ncbi:adenosylcobinamide-phosphate synthase CbiB [Thermodesulfobacteriota bacterium]
MEFSFSYLILPAAFLLDIILGDPEKLPHPIRWMGRAITAAEPLFRRLPQSATLSGAFFAVSLISATWFLTFSLVKTAGFIHPVFGTGVETLLIYTCISVSSLASAAMAVYTALRQNRLQEAKANIARIVGRDVENFMEKDISRAAVETVGENLVDGIISPLFYAAIGGAPLAMAYKMINTLDSMIGYKNDAYRHFGKVAARIDDVANFIPARLSIPVIAIAAQILCGKGSRTLRIAVLEGENHSSPNAGYPEAAFAGTLGVRLGGPSTYQGKLVSKPYIGFLFGDAAPAHIPKACDLMVLSSFLWLLISCVITVVLRIY